MYYEQEMTQNEIGAQLGLSRVKVYRLLKQAKENQVVQTYINWPIERNSQLEESLKAYFGLKEAFVLKTSPSTNDTSLLSRLGKVGAQYLEQMLKDGMTLAICMGRSTFEVIQAIRPEFQSRVCVAQATGSVPFPIEELDSRVLARQVADKLGGEVSYLSSPLVADSIEAADVLRSLQEIKNTLTIASQADVALVGIGNLDPQISSFAKTGFMSPDVLAALKADGAAGDMAGQIFTLSGETHSSQYNQRIIGITLDDLCQIPLVIAVAAGQDKAAAILGSLRTSAIKVLCIDDQAARGVLRLSGVK